MARSPSGCILSYHNFPWFTRYNPEQHRLRSSKVWGPCLSLKSVGLRHLNTCKRFIVPNDVAHAPVSEKEGSITSFWAWEGWDFSWGKFVGCAWNPESWVADTVSLHVVVMWNCVFPGILDILNRRFVRQRAKGILIYEQSFLSF